MIPVKASGWFNTDMPETDKGVLIKSGLLPVNDIYLPFYITDAKVILAYGGRGGGKSEAVADLLIDQCATQPYFKCYYGRKVYENVRGSCFDTIIYCIEKRGLQTQFNYSKSNSSSMVITHLATGNKFIPFGSDKADKLKSIKDPTHIWCEEFDQFTFEDFRELFPTLRTTRGKNLFIATFNTHCVFTTHWIIKYFFPDLYSGEDKAKFDILEGMEVLKIFANYTDNLFIDQEDYCQRLKMASGGNPSILEGIANGAWGILENNNPWLYAFDEGKHVKARIQFLDTFPIYIFIDINNSPLECTLWQMSPNLGGASSFLHCFDMFSGNYKVDQLAHMIKTKYPNSIMYLGGDRSGQNADVGRNQTVYQIMAGILKLGKKQLLMHSQNLEHYDSWLLCNTMFANYSNIFISGENCKKLINQCIIAKIDVESSKPGQLLKDRELYKLDAFDSMRYLFQDVFNNFVKDTYFKAQRRK